MTDYIKIAEKYQKEYDEGVRYLVNERCINGCDVPSEIIEEAHIGQKRSVPMCPNCHTIWHRIFGMNPNKTNKGLTEDIKSEIMRLRKEGLSFREIEEQTKVSKSVICEFINKEGH